MSGVRVIAIFEFNLFEAHRSRGIPVTRQDIIPSRLASQVNICVTWEGGNIWNTFSCGRNRGGKDVSEERENSNFSE